MSLWSVVLLMMMIAFGASTATVYKVGDSAGWTTIGNVDYKQWSATKDFKIGDIISFEYNAQFHNVMRVTHAMYKTCNTSSPIATFTTGNDTIRVTTSGHHFFFCGVPGHCQAGQKVDIHVLRDSERTTTPSALASPTGPDIVPEPSQSTAAAFISSQSTCLGVILLKVAIAVLLLNS